MTQAQTPPTVHARSLAPEGPLPADRFVVDVRTPAEYDEVHIEGTLNFPLGDLSRTATRIADLAQGREVTLVCRSGKRAEEARKLLAAAGVTEAHCLEGGIESWITTGNPVRRGEGKAISLERQVRIVAGGLVALGSAAAWFLSPAWVALPAFVGCGLVFAGVTDTCGMAMVLARMPWNRRSVSADTRTCTA